jgi:mannose-6-phosphate isomerase-like protein (cupin superfamily)
MHERAATGSFDYVMHGGAAPIHLQWYFRESSQLPVAVQLWGLPPGGSEGMHSHPRDKPLEELYLVLSGRVEMMVDEINHQLQPGDAILAPPGSRHDLRNTGEESAQVLVVWGAPGAGIDWSAYASGRAARAAAPVGNSDCHPSCGTP